MDRRIKTLIDLARSKFGLRNYDLKEQRLFRSVNVFNDTVYTLSMEWIPNHIPAGGDEDDNPEGTAVVEMDVATRRVKSIVFVAGRSFADGPVFSGRNRAGIIEWIERETGLTYEKQFRLCRKEPGALHFKACVEGIDLFPPGSIDIEWNANGQLIQFSMDFQMPSAGRLIKDSYSLVLDEIGAMAKKQLTFINWPLFEKKKYVPLYAIDEVFVRNTDGTPIAYSAIDKPGSYIELNTTLYWDNPQPGKPFQSEALQLQEDVTVEQAFSSEPAPEACPINRLEQRKCMEAVKDFMSREHPDESGKWLLNALRREKEYIEAMIRLVNKSKNPFTRKLILMLDHRKFSVRTFIDNKPIVDKMDAFQPAAKVTVAKDAAYEKIRPLLKLKPYYVYDADEQKYVLCGKLDCDRGVDASSGDVLDLHTL